MWGEIEQVIEKEIRMEEETKKEEDRASRGEGARARKMIEGWGVQI
jgi:hypothetical protein